MSLYLVGGGWYSIDLSCTAPRGLSICENFYGLVCVFVTARARAAVKFTTYLL